MTAFLEFLQAIGKWLKDNWTAIGLGIFNYEEDRVDQAKTQQLKAENELAVEKANAEIDAKNSGRSDADIVNDAINNGSGGQPGSGSNNGKTGQ